MWELIREFTIEKIIQNCKTSIMRRNLWKLPRFSFRILRRTLPFFIISLFHFCIYPIREAEVLETDVSFLYLNSTEFPQNELEKMNSIWKVRKLRDKGTTAEDKNNLGILFAKNSLLDDAESFWKECMKISESNPVCFSNLIRMYYLIDEYEISKKEISIYLKTAKKEQIQQVKKLLTNQNRKEETILLLDVQSKIPGMEVVSWDELSTYFLEKQDYEKAYFYLEKILEINPYHKNARASMVLLAHDLEKWDDLLMFAMNLNSTDDKIPDLNYYIAKAYYEKRNYSEALEWIRKSPESERETLSFIELWKKILLSVNPNSDLHPILTYIKKMQAKGIQIKEEDVLPTLNPSGKKTIEDIKVGR
ncbi:tetratricopeptide repeat protein [Leptospira interrogans]|uniref:tetratricopeptide repeat protein n=1 Tax=Leptospira interrogans TaxID=173 RepID=UPI00034CB3D9|nr:hypothetical protein [Leptospira interrogans]